jgi:hypothetical protein
MPQHHNPDPGMTGRSDGVAIAGTVGKPHRGHGEGRKRATIRVGVLGRHLPALTAGQAAL